MIIYCAANKLNGKRYVGKTSNSLKRRVSEHIHGVGRPFRALSAAIGKYGKDNFSFDTIAWCDTEDKLNFLEKFYIKYFNCKAPNGYNLTDGGEGTLGHKKSEETRKRLSQALKGRKGWNKGLRLKPWSEETRRKTVKAMKDRYAKIPHHMNGKKHSEETKRKISETHIGTNLGPLNGMFGKPSPMRGKNQTEESRKKDSESKKKNWQDPEYRRKILEARKRPSYGPSFKVGARKRWQRPEERERARLMQIERWKDPEFRKMQIENLNKARALRWQREREDKRESLPLE